MLDWLIGDAQRRGYLLLLPALAICGLLLMAPLLILIVSSFWLQHGFELTRTFDLGNYAMVLFKGAYLSILGRSILVSIAATALVVVFSFPVAYFIAFHGGPRRGLWLFLVTVPFWTSYLVRIFAWKTVLGYNGVINSGLISLGLIDRPLEILLYNPYAVTLSLAHSWAPFALLPIYVSLQKIDKSVIEAAADLGDPWWRTLRDVILPLASPGILAAVLLVFIPTVGDYVTPQLVGGTSGVMIGNVIQSAFGRSNNWPLGAALSIVTITCVTALACLLISRSGKARLKGTK